MNDISKFMVINMAFASTPLSAAFVCLSDFEGATLGSSVSTQGWDGSAKAMAYTTIAQAPDDSSNQVLKTTCSSGANGVYLDLGGTGGTGGIEAGSAGTVFLRVFYSSSVDYALSFGMGYSMDPNYMLQAQILTSSIGASKWQAYSSATGALNVTTPKSLLSGTWYNIWIVMNPGGVANTWQAYCSVDGGSQTMFAASQASTFNFKKGASYDRPSDRFEIVFNGVSSVLPGEAAAVYFDDIYIDNAGVNLAIPIPEAGAYCWGGALGIVAAGMLVRRRRQG